ncbi:MULTISPECIES: GNAT family N-acetyltransferase [Clostridia]|uniref:GNAT family N-acetyltransferase n=1 Tax=Clostridia TaxID=186801 RepID=UPI000EA2E6D4|nr:MULTISPECIES: GNAT family N-acetyltransferase [Clostridia]NBJ69738.1 GNAT family N-acetyltransferase [Roseburia sp. 1XD42-34]RKI78102.1 GNAT family N-acetyltransferase [Clostridium sp. 1xD42-85]
MEAQFTKSLDRYLGIVEEELLKKEACNNLMLGILERLQREQGNCYLGWVEKDGRLLLPFLRTPPHNWVLPDLKGDLNKEVVQCMVEQIRNGGWEVPGVIGPESYATKFAEEWGKLTNCTASIHMRELIYQLNEVKRYPQQPGELMVAKEQDLSLLIDWLQQFGKQAGEDISLQRAEQIARRFITEQSAFFWRVNDQLVSKVNRSRTTRNGATINAVFTPDRFKGNGYVTNAVAVLSQQLLNKGYQFCSLYTDVSNPISNYICQKIGYYKVGSAMVYAFQCS